MKAARQSHVDPADVVELGGSGAGGHRHGVLAGIDVAGTTRLSFLTGFGMSDFVPGATFANSRRPMLVTESVEGPSTEARIVGIVGVATPAVERVAVQLVDGSAITLPVSRATGIPFEGFSYVSADAVSFPARVIGFNAAGKVVAEHVVDAAPLCRADQPDCLD